jgi:hypothetical protein
MAQQVLASHLPLDTLSKNLRLGEQRLGEQLWLAILTDSNNTKLAECLKAAGQHWDTPTKAAHS